MDGSSVAVRPVRQLGGKPVPSRHSAAIPVPVRMPDFGSASAGPARPVQEALVTIGIAESVALTRLGLRSILQTRADFRVVGEAHDAPSTVELAFRHRPAVLIVDAELAAPSVPGLVAMLHTRLPGTRVVAMSVKPVADALFRALSAGAAGFLIKDCEPDDLIDGVRAVASGGTVIAPSAARELTKWFVGMDVERAKQAEEMLGWLTARELEVLERLAGGLGNHEIARALYMSEGAVKAHISRVLSKFRCTNRVQAAAVYYDARLPH